jgi:hypothetical protein
LFLGPFLLSVRDYLIVEALKMGGSAKVLQGETGIVEAI